MQEGMKGYECAYYAIVEDGREMRHSNFRDDGDVDRG